MGEEPKKEARPDAAGQDEVADADLPQDPAIPGPKPIAEQPDDLSVRPPGQPEPEGPEPT